MKKKRRIIAFAIVTILMFNFSVVQAAGFDAPVPLSKLLIMNLFHDVPESHAQYDPITELEELGYVIGVGDEYFKPDDMTTRAEFAKMLIFAVGKDEEAEYKKFFVDVPQEHWASGYIMRAVEVGVVGTDEIGNNEFRPDDYIDRETAALWISRAMGVSLEADISAADADEITYKSEAATVLDLGLMELIDNNFLPKETFKRSDAAVIIKKVMDEYSEWRYTYEDKEEVVYKSEVININSNENTNIVIENAEDYIIFENVDETISGLSAGDIIKVEACEAVPFGCAVKVLSMETDGTRVTIQKDATIDISDVAEHIDIAKTVPITADDLTLDDGVKLVDNPPLAQLNVDDNLTDGGVVNPKGANIAIVPELYLEIDKDVGEFGNISGNVTLGIGVEADFKYEGFWAAPEVELIAHSDIDATVEVSGSIDGGKDSINMLIAPDIRVPIGSTGAYVEGNIYLSFDLRGGVKVKFDQENRVGFRYENSKIYKINEKSGDGLTPTLETSASIYLGPKLDLSLEWLGIIGVGTNAGIYGGVEASLENTPHNAMFCVDGAIKLKIDLSIYLKIGPFEPGVKPLNIKFTLGDFYLHRSNGAQYGEFGWGDCPYLEIVDPTPPTDDPTPPTNDPNPPTPTVAFEKIGNGNAANGGFAATDGEYVYYSADDNLYKQSLNGGDKTVLAEGTCCAINVYDGYVYYNKYNFMSGSICRIRTDGSSDEEYITGAAYGGCIQVVDGYLYYVSDYEIKKLSIADIGSESLEKTVLGETNDVFVVDNGSIYFLNSDEERGAIGLASMSTDGDDFRILVEGSCRSINVVDGYVYYIKNPYGNNGFNSIYRVGVNGGNEELLLEEEGVFNINVYNNNIYFDREDPEYGLGSISVSGENKQFYEAEGLNEFCIINDIIYTRDPDGYENVDIFSLLTQ